MKKILYFILVLLSMICTQNHAYSEPMYFTYSIDMFYNNDTTSLLELNYQFAENGLKYTTPSNTGELALEFVLTNKSGIVLYEKWENKLKKSDKINNYLMALKLITVKPNTYQAMLKYKDVNNTANSDSVKFEINVRNFSQKKINLSDLQIASEITPSTDESHIYYKNGMIVMPNLLANIEPPFLVLNTYLEIYNSNLSPTLEYSVNYAIADSTGKIFYKKEQKNQRTDETGITEINSFPMSELPSGKYYLMVTAYQGLMRSAKDSSRVVKPFFLQNPEVDSIIKNNKSATEIFSKMSREADPMFSTKTENELDIDFKKSKYILTNTELEMWKKMDGKQAKANFLTNVWSKRDPDPNTAKNEALDDYYKRVAECKKFSCNFYPEGWESDRGRIFLQYGKPNNITKQNFKLQQKPYEIWDYANPNYTFVFVDKTQTGTFSLRHSTHPNEISNEDWFDRDVFINSQR